MNSIRESFDNLPVAVCFFDKRGVVRLMNRRMLSVGAELLGSGVQTLEELHRALDNPPESIERLDAEMGVYKFPSGTVLRFVERQITDKSGGSYTEVTASDVTRLVTLQQELRKERCSNQSFNLFAVTMKRMGVEVTFVNPDCSAEELDAAFRPNTKAMYGETIANPALTVLDIEKFAAAAHRHGVPLIVDNTFATPINCRPFEWGADIVVHSTTKYMDGHAGAIGGAIVDSGKFDWTKYPDKYPGLCTPDESYHGVTYTERFGLAGAYITKATVQLMRDLGAIQSPQSAYYLNLGLESLHVRMPRHCENAQKVAEFLQQHENVSWVQYCGLPGDKYYELGQKYLPHGSCGVVSFGVKGGRAAAETVMGRLKVASIETHVADSHTCCLHPASTTHRQMNAEELQAAGVREDLIRYSCGLEDAEDLIADLDQALR